MAIYIYVLVVALSTSLFNFFQPQVNAGILNRRDAYPEHCPKLKTVKELDFRAYSKIIWNVLDTSKDGPGASYRCLAERIDVDESKTFQSFFGILNDEKKLKKLQITPFENEQGLFYLNGRGLEKDQSVFAILSNDLKFSVEVHCLYFGNGTTSVSYRINAKGNKLPDDVYNDAVKLLKEQNVYSDPMQVDRNCEM